MKKLLLGSLFAALLFSACNSGKGRLTVSIEGLQGDETLTVDLTNKFTDRSSTVGGDGSSGSQTGLKPGMTYTLTLRDGGHTLASVTVETEREIVTFFHLEDAGCTCLLDGMFHFSAEIIDGGVQHGFTATLTDWYGNVSTVSIDPEAGEYSIPVTGTALLGDSAMLTISCIQDGSSPTGSTERDRSSTPPRRVSTASTRYTSPCPRSSTA